MKTRYISAVAVVAAFVGGCATPFSEAPLATNFPTTKQQKVQAAGHWNVIAKDVAMRISSGVNDNRPLFVKEAATGTDFDSAFADQLISALVEQGRIVSKVPYGALLVEIKTKAIRFSADRQQYRHFGEATLLAAGVWTLVAVDATAGGVVTAAAIGADAFSASKSEFASGATPQTEIIITTSIGDDSRYLAHNTSIYYVADSDRSLYESNPLQTVRILGGD